MINCLFFFFLQKRKATVATGTPASGETGNFHMTDLLSTNQHIPPKNVNEKRRLSPHMERPPPCLAYQPSLSCVPLFLWISLLLPLVYRSTISCPLIVALPSPLLTCLYTPLSLSLSLRGHLFSCRVDVCGSAGTCAESVCCSSARSPIVVFFFPPPLPPPSPGHMVVPKGKSELSTRTHPQTARAPSEMELDNRSSSKTLVFEEELGK